MGKSMPKPTSKPLTSPKTQARFAQALGLHQQGRLVEAKAVYGELLRANPRHAEALQLLGVIAYQSNLHQEALDLIDQALAIQPDNAYFLSNRGNSLKALGRFEDAVAILTKQYACGQTTPMRTATVVLPCTPCRRSRKPCKAMTAP